MRAINEWIAKNDNQAIPTRVKLRIHVLYGGRCAICHNSVIPGRQFDHITALCNGGEHRESNLQLLCVPCHKAKTAIDLAEKAKIARKRKAHLGIKPKSPWRPMLGTKKSGIRKRMNGAIEKWK